MMLVTLCILWDKYDYDTEVFQDLLDISFGNSYH